MEWLESIRKSIKYIENNLLTVSGVEEVAKAAYMSPYYLQNGFKVMTGYSVAEYIRNRRLYLAALDLRANKCRVIDAALNYGYDSPDSFTKAFVRFHGVTPKQVKNNSGVIRVFLPLKITVTIQGGAEMDVIIEKMSGFKVVGYEKRFGFENAYEDIPKFWDDVYQTKIAPLYTKGNLTNEEEVMVKSKIGVYGVNIDDIGNGKFRYLIAGEMNFDNVPKGMTVYEFPDMEWAKFKCVGPMPGALQSVNTKIFEDWLPNNSEYEIAFPASIEWYSSDDMMSSDYESGIWIPIKRKS